MPRGNVKSVVEQTVKPLVERVDHLALAVAGEMAGEEARMEGVQGGAVYEDRVVKVLSDWARFSGARIAHVGPDNTSGDVLVTIPSSVPGQPPVKLVVEAKSESETDAKGRVSVSKIIRTCIENRKSEGAVYVSETLEGLRKDVSDWAEGEIGEFPWVTTIHDDLITAVRYVAAMRRLNMLARESIKQRPDITNQVAAIRSALNHLKNINTNCTNLGKTVDGIRSEATEMREKVDEALGEIEKRLANAE